MSVRSKRRATALAGVLLASAGLAGAGPAGAETLEGALARAYGNNPSLNAQRAVTRSNDENVPRARSQGRPFVNATGDVGAAYTNFSQPSNGGAGGAGGTAGGVFRGDFSSTPRGVGFTIDQNLFNGGRTVNGIRQAESFVEASRETLFDVEQNTLYNAAEAYMNVLRDTAILGLRNNNVEVIDEQLRQTRDRFNVGEVTRTDVAQSEARLAAGRSQVSLAEANLKASIARYRQIIGVEPGTLAPGRPVSALLPKSVDAAIRFALGAHPRIRAAFHQVDAAELQVKLVEAELLPTLGLQGSAQQRYDSSTSGDQRFGASVVARLNVPIYQGGEVYARVRQNKEILGQRRLDADTARDEVRALVVSAYGAYDAAGAQIQAANAQVAAAETALAGVREEAKVGQRTTLDVLNSQQELLDARVNIITAQRDRVVASYRVLQAVGTLGYGKLRLKTERYSAAVHYDQVKDLLFGVRTPDGR